MSFIESFLGRLLYNVRAGPDGLVSNHADIKSVDHTIIGLSSPDFENGGSMPLYSAGKRADGENIFPELNISNVPEGAASLLLILQDIDAPTPKPILHFVAYGISPSTTTLSKGSFETQTLEEWSKSKLPYKLGYAVFKRLGYNGPGPVRNHGPHAYHFQIYALDKVATEALDKFTVPPSLNDILTSASGHVLAGGKLTGTYERF